MTIQPPVRFLCGIRGYGKSTMARALVAPAPRLLAFDPFSEHDALALDFGDLEDFLDTTPDLGAFRVSLREAGHEEGFCGLALATARLLQKEHPPGGLTVLLEEADLVARPGQEPPVFQDLVARGRHDGIELVCVSRRPAEVSRLITSQAEFFYVFRTQEPRDVTYLRGYIGEAAALAAQHLDKFHYVAWSGGKWTEMHGEAPVGAPAGTASSSEAENAEKS
jgi:hypothetical protein